MVLSFSYAFIALVVPLDTPSKFNPSFSDFLTLGRFFSRDFCALAPNFSPNMDPAMPPTTPPIAVPIPGTTEPSAAPAAAPAAPPANEPPFEPRFSFPPATNNPAPIQAPRIRCFLPMYVPALRLPPLPTFPSPLFPAFPRKVAPFPFFPLPLRTAPPVPRASAFAN